MSRVFRELFYFWGNKYIIPIAHSLEVEKIKDYITSDTLGYLSTEGIAKAVTNGDKSLSGKSSYCFACFDGNYPVEITDEKVSHQQMDLF
jgi:amidophosphoribosyltransferase